MGGEGKGREEQEEKRNIRERNSMDREEWGLWKNRMGVGKEKN